MLSSFCWITTDTTVRNMETKALVGSLKPRRSCHTRRRGQQFVRSATHAATAVQRRAHWSTAEGKMTPLSACIIPQACDRGAGESVGGYGRGTKGQEGPKRSEQVLAPSSRLQMCFLLLGVDACQYKHQKIFVESSNTVALG